MKAKPALASGILASLLGLSHSHGATLSAGPTFETGDVFWARVNGSQPLELTNISGGGTFSSGDQFAEIGRSPGQMAWKADLTTAYVTEFDNDRVVAVSPSGTVTTFASGIENPTGLLWTSDSRLLVVSNTFLGSGRVFDISGGGDFAGAIPFATGFSDSRNLLQISGGGILLVDQRAGAVFDVTGGGDFSSAVPFASGFASPVDLIQVSDGRILLSDPAAQAVFDITGGGPSSTAPAFASGETFSGLTVDGEGRILSSEFGSSLVFDISSGSSIPFASHSLGDGHSLLDTVPVPEPGSVALIFLSAWVFFMQRRRA